MSDQKDQSAKTKAKKMAYNVLSKTGHWVRKSLPYLIPLIIAAISANTHDKDNNDSSTT